MSRRRAAFLALVRLDVLVFQAFTFLLAFQVFLPAVMPTR